MCVTIKCFNIKLSTQTSKENDKKLIMKSKSN